VFAKLTLTALLATTVFAGIATAQTRTARPFGSTPKPTRQQLDEERRFVAGVVDPQNTLDLIVGRPRVILLKATPTRTQVADESVATFRVLEPDAKQMTVIGAKPGITVLNLWFQEPAAKDKEKILSYMVRVLPDPEAKQRVAAGYTVLANEINRAFPDSRVRFSPVGSAVILSGQAHDIAQAAKIVRVAKSPGK
jgi:pilus assembly protein CpaC